MARTNPWDENDPSNTTEARYTAQRIVQTELNVREVVNQLIGVAETTAFSDPVVASSHTLNSLYDWLNTIQPGGSGGTNVSVPQLTITTAASRIIPGATSLSLRNSANTQDNLLVSDAGVVTVRSNLNVSGSIGAGGTTAISINALTLSLACSSGLLAIGAVSGDQAASTINLPQMPHCSGAPSGSVADGTFMVDTTTHRFYVRSGGLWKYAALT